VTPFTTPARPQKILKQQRLIGGKSISVANYQTPMERTLEYLLWESYQNGTACQKNLPATVVTLVTATLARILNAFNKLNAAAMRNCVSRFGNSSEKLRVGFFGVGRWSACGIVSIFARVEHIVQLLPEKQAW